jgi:predicted MFS family arabinose efflux permease
LAIIGLANILGSLLAGWGTQRVRSKYILFWMYGSRALLILVYLAAPKTAMTFYLFAAGLGLTWLATVPPTATIVGKLFGTRYLATLFGLTLLSHQIGAFLGAWLGGLAVVNLGNYTGHVVSRRRPRGFGRPGQPADPRSADCTEAATRLNSSRPRRIA